MFFRSALISTSLIALLSACGGATVNIDELNVNNNFDSDGLGSSAPIEGTVSSPPAEVNLSNNTGSVVEVEKVNDSDENAALPESEGVEAEAPKPTIIVVDTDGDGVANDKDAFPNISGTDLDSFTEIVVLQSLALDTTNNQVGVSEAAKSTTSRNWASTTTDYVVKLNNDDIVGIAMDSIPASVEFAATGTASMYIVDGTTQYGLQKGDVSGSISSDASQLTVNLSWAGDDISDPENGEQNASAPTAMTMTLISSQTGATDCGGANILCGGTVSVTSDGSSLIDTTNLSASQYKAGIYGSTAANAELGGQINYVDPDNKSIVGSYIADTK